MTPEHAWTTVDTYLESTLLPADPVLADALARSSAAGLPPIQVPPLQGRFLQLLATAVGARRILEFGTLAGYSALWLGRALPADGRLTSLEIDPVHAEVARANLAAAGLADRVEVIVGPAAESLEGLDDEVFDLTFVDADKTSTAAYVDWAAAHTRSGGVIVVDNVVRQGKVADAGSDDPSVRGIRQFLEQAAADGRLELTALQTVGAKGYDGFALAVVR